MKNSYIGLEAGDDAHRIRLYKLFVTLAWISIMLGIVYSRFTEDTMEAGFEILGEGSSKLLTVFSSVLAGIQFFSNVLGIRPKQDSKKVLGLDDNLKVIVASPSINAGSNADAKVSPLGTFCSRTSMGVTFLTGAAATVLPLYPYVKKYPYISIPLAVLIIGANSIYFILLSKKDVDSGLHRFSKKDPAFFSLMSQSKLLFIQANFKNLVTTIYRGAMHAYIGDEFFKNVLDVKEPSVSMLVKIVCGTSAAVVSILSRTFPVFDNYYNSLSRVSSEQHRAYISQMLTGERALTTTKVLPLSVFRCGYAYVLGSIFSRILAKQIPDPVPVIIGTTLAVLAGLLLFSHSYLTDYGHEINNKVIQSLQGVQINARNQEINSEGDESDRYVDNNNKICKIISIFINAASQFTWGMVGITFLNSILSGILNRNEIIVAATSVGAELGYTSYFYMGPKIQNGLIAAINSGINLFKCSFQRKRAVHEPLLGDIHMEVSL